MFKLAHFRSKRLQRFPSPSWSPSTWNNCNHHWAVHRMNSFHHWRLSIDSHSINETPHNRAYHVSNTIVLSTEHPADPIIPEKLFSCDGNSLWEKCIRSSDNDYSCSTAATVELIACETGVSILLRALFHEPHSMHGYSWRQIPNIWKCNFLETLLYPNENRGAAQIQIYYMH